MRFLALPRDDSGDARSLPEHRSLARALVGTCTLAIAATAFPWIAVEAPHLFGAVVGPIAARTSPGFTCVTTCALTMLLLLGEGRTRDSREAVRTASAVLLAVALAVLLLHWLAGPGALRGADADFTAWFFVATALVGLGVLCARVRLGT